MFYFYRQYSKRRFPVFGELKLVADGPTGVATPEISNRIGGADVPHHKRLGPLLDTTTETRLMTRDCFDNAQFPHKNQSLVILYL